MTRDQPSAEAAEAARPRGRRSAHSAGDAGRRSSPSRRAGADGRRRPMATPRRPAAGRTAGGPARGRRPPVAGRRRGQEASRRRRRRARRRQPAPRASPVTRGHRRRPGRARRGDAREARGAGAQGPPGRPLPDGRPRAGPKATQIAVLEGRSLIEHYVSRPADDISQIHGNIYLGRVQNVLPGMEAAFVDIGTPKNAVLYRGDTRYDPEDLDEKRRQPAHRADPQGPPDDPLPGHQEPDRGQGRPPHPGGVAAGPVRRADARTAPPTASRSGCPTTSASGSAASSTRCGPRATA